VESTATGVRAELQLCPAEVTHCFMMCGLIVYGIWSVSSSACMCDGVGVLFLVWVPQNIGRYVLCFEKNKMLSTAFFVLCSMPIYSMQIFPIDTTKT